MENVSKQQVDLCWKLVTNTTYSVLIINHFGSIYYYLTKGFNYKTMNNPYNEVIDGQDITDLVENQQFNFKGQVNDEQLATKVQNIPLQNFKFGHDQFIWLTSMRENVNF